MKKKIYFIDLTHASKLGFGSDTMPLQLGLLASYCLKQHKDKIEVELFKLINEFEQAIKTKEPFIVAASNYMWNINLTYEAIKVVKERYPSAIIVVGGPNYPDSQEEQVSWLKEHPLVDFYVYRDGEIPFSNLVEHLLNENNLETIKKKKLESCHAIINDEAYFGELALRPKDLSIIPSPYTTGLMDKFFDQKFLPMIQTNRGCPFSCTFCTEGNRYYSIVSKLSFDHKKSEVDYIVDKVKYTKTLRVTDSNFGMYKEDVDFCKYLGEVQKKTGYPEYISCSTGKNQKERVLECNKLVQNALRLTASVQSLNENVLKNMKRSNISLDGIIEMSDTVSDTDSHSYSEIILGLAGDTLDAQKESIKGLMNAGISNITQHQLSLIYSTETNSKETRKKWDFKTKFRPIQRCLGKYTFDSKIITPIEIEEICVGNSNMTYEDYLEARKLYIIVGIFYNDRIFGEIHALLRLLNLPTWDWIETIFNNQKKFTSSIKKVFDDFVSDTKAELWDTPENLVKDVSKNIEKYHNGEIGGNLIYKYRSKAIIQYFSDTHFIAFDNLRKYLKNKNTEIDDLVNQMEDFSKSQKGNIFDTSMNIVKNYDYDLIKMIKSASEMREAKNINVIKYPIKVRIEHSEKQKELINRQLAFYGDDNAGLSMLLSRFPLKRFYRDVNHLN
jgi:radical SAM superfamily enzyme YgiQ (UPF0313 family)